MSNLTQKIVNFMLGIIYKSRSAKTYFQRVTPNRSEGVFVIKEKRKRNINIDPL